jgi:hypothetical protein
MAGTKTLSVPWYFVCDWISRNKYAKQDHCPMLFQFSKDFNGLSADTLMAWTPEDTKN